SSSHLVYTPPLFSTSLFTLPRPSLSPLFPYTTLFRSGGALILSNNFRSMLDGIELSDSVTLDFHKHYFQTISCGAFLLKDEANYRFMHYEAEYLNSAYDEEHGVPNLVSKSLQTTRRFDALKLWMTVEALGEELYGSMIDHGVKLTREVADYINATAGLEMLVYPQFAY